MRLFRRLSDDELVDVARKKLAFSKKWRTWQIVGCGLFFAFGLAYCVAVDRLLGGMMDLGGVGPNDRAVVRWATALGVLLGAKVGLILLHPLLVAFDLFGGRRDKELLVRCYDALKAHPAIFESVVSPSEEREPLLSHSDYDSRRPYE